MSERYDRGYPQALARIAELEAKLKKAVWFVKEVAEQNEHPEDLANLAKGILKELEGKADE